MISISAYTTIRNPVAMDYPFLESIKSMLQFADEVVIVDSSDVVDHHTDELFLLMEKDERVRLIQTDKFDWKAPNHGIFDGQTKALARSYCKGNFLWQFDTDEIVHELDAPKIRPLIEKLNYLQKCPIMALPVVEYWGSQGKVRADINPWKARISRNLPDITHGIPVQLRRTFNGLDYASPGTDTCDYISKSTGKVLPVMGFMDPQIEGIRQMCLKNPKLIPAYEKWFNNAVNELPGVFHYSWFSVERKIKQYKSFWTSFWKAMYGPDSAQNKDPDWNPFFEVPWSQVTDQMIKDKAQELEMNTGGHIFHSRWTGVKTPHVTINREHPKLIQEWVKNHD
jgi:hypothetical protein